jgi:AraC-like DNA-binding protein
MKQTREGRQMNHVDHATRAVLNAGQTMSIAQHSFAIAIVMLRGGVVIEYEGSAWITQAGHCVVMPPGRRLSIAASRHSEMRLIETDHFEDVSVRMVQVTPLLHALAQHDSVAANARQMRALFLAEIDRSDLVQPAVRLPHDLRARWIAQAILDDPSELRSLADFAALSGTARRTLLRLFTAQSGLSFRQFRQHVRIYSSLEMLAGSETVQEIAFAIGYESSAAFICAFRKIMGQPPGQYRLTQLARQFSCHAGRV